MNEMDMRGERLDRPQWTPNPCLCVFGWEWKEWKGILHDPATLGRLASFASQRLMASHGVFRTTDDDSVK